MEAVRPLSIAVPQRDLDDLTDRLRRTRWPDRRPSPTGAGGCRSMTCGILCRCWADGYDWRATEQWLNLLPHFTTCIDDVDIHFVHLRSAHPDAIPLVLTHGWPGSLLEFEQVLAPLARGDRAESSAPWTDHATPWCRRPGKPSGSHPTILLGGSAIRRYPVLGRTGARRSLRRLGTARGVRRRDQRRVPCYRQR